MSELYGQGMQVETRKFCNFFLSIFSKIIKGIFAISLWNKRHKLFFRISSIKNIKDQVFKLKNALFLFNAGGLSSLYLEI